MNKSKLQTWLRNQILVARASGKVIRMDLCHLPIGSKSGHEVQTFDCPGEKPEDAWFEETVNQVEAASQNDAAAIGGTQCYALSCYREKDPEKRLNRFLFRVASEDDNEETTDGFNSEPATGKGLLTQLMRHNEASNRALVLSLSAVMSTMQRTMAVMAEQNDKLQTQRIESLEQMEEILSTKLDRELAIDREKNHNKMMGELLGELKLLGPAVVEKLTGAKLPGSSSPREVAISRFIGSLSQDQIVNMSKGLSQAQQIVLGELMQALQGSN